jgi:N-acetylmuramoyl-L-alanine amidase
MTKARQIKIFNRTVSLGMALTIALCAVVVTGSIVEAATHRVLPGDTLWKLGRQYGVSVQALKTHNGLTSDMIRVGQRLEIPPAVPSARPAAGDVELLARMIAAEASGEPYRGMVAVGAVIMNRVRSPRFPNSLRAVLFQPRQFEPVANGHFWRVKVNATHRRAAREALAGSDPTGGALFFFAPAKTRSAWMWSRPVLTQIGRHRFTR